MSKNRIDLEIQPNSNCYLTSDLYLAAYLKTKGHKFTVEKLKSKSNFQFEESPELLSNVDEYLTEKGSCEPLAFTNSIKNIKNLLWNNR
jgi:hypothetical protein